MLLARRKEDGAAKAVCLRWKPLSNDQAQSQDWYNLDCCFDINSETNCSKLTDFANFDVTVYWRRPWRPGPFHLLFPEQPFSQASSENEPGHKHCPQPSVGLYNPKGNGASMVPLCRRGHIFGVVPRRDPFAGACSWMWQGICSLANQPPRMWKWLCNSADEGM